MLKVCVQMGMSDSLNDVTHWTEVASFEYSTQSMFYLKSLYDLGTHHYLCDSAQMPTSTDYL